MAINKVVDRNGSTLIDLTNDTVKPNKVLAGTKFHGADGREYTGSLPANELDTLKYTFIDYDGEVMYTYTDEELDALTELPVGPDHTDENLTFQEWNWTLEELKAWDRTRIDRPIVGANLITTDGKTYITLTTLISSTTEKLMLSATSSSPKPEVEIDWGDGTVESITVNRMDYVELTHTYPAGNTEYTIILNPTTGASNLRIGMSGNYGVTDSAYGYNVTDIKLGNFKEIGCRGKFYGNRSKKINIPTGVSFYSSDNIPYTFLNAIVLPAGLTEVTKTSFNNSYSLKTVSLPNTITTIKSSAFAGCYNLANIVLPDSLVTMESSIFQSDRCLRSIVIPDGITSLPDYCFGDCSSLKTLILSKNLVSIGSRAIYQTNSLEKLDLPDTLTTLAYGCFENISPLKELIIPGSVTSIGNSAFIYLTSLETLDLSASTSVIPITGDILSFTKNFLRILVPAALLDSYKSASYWSSHASKMIGV